MPIAHFPDDRISLDQINGKATFIVAKPIGCTWNGYYVEAPVDFSTDLASTPRPFRKSGKWNRAAVLHDFIYRGGLASKGGVMLRMSRAEADEMFLDAMTALGVDGRSFAMYAGVRAAFWQERRFP